jgi:hypothetical protein
MKRYDLAAVPGSYDNWHMQERSDGEFIRYSDIEQRLAIARECLRQIWQHFDAGGISMGRSQDALWLETAIDLIDYDHRYAELADRDPKAFEKIREDARWQANKERVAAHHEAMGLVDSTTVSNSDTAST